MNNPAHSIAVLNCSGNANRPELSRTVPSRAEPYRTMQWKSVIKDYFDHVDWDIFRAASDDDIKAYSDSVMCFIRKCIEDVVPTKIICIYPNQKPWINSDVRSALSARTSAFKSGNSDDRKQASYDLRRSIKAAKRQYKNKVKEHFNTNNARSMCQGINNITGFKGNKPATVSIAASLPDELNTFYARFEADNTAHTVSAPVAAILTGCIPAWFGNSTAGNRKALQRIVRTARHIVGGELPSLQDIYTRRCTRKARRIIKDSSHPSHILLSLLPSGRRLRSIRSHTSRLRDSFFPQAIRLMNSQN